MVYMIIGYREGGVFGAVLQETYTSKYMAIIRATQLTHTHEIPGIKRWVVIDTVLCTIEPNTDMKRVHRGKLDNFSV